MKLRNIEFVGDDFDSFEPINAENSAYLDSFSFYPVTLRYSDGRPDRDTQELQDFQLFFDMPLSIFSGGKIIEATLKVHLDLRNSEVRESKDILFLELVYAGTRVKSAWGDFELGLQLIQKQLSPDVYIKSCINCEFSSISRYQGIFGSVGCYRDNKEKYKKIKQNWVHGSKWKLLAIMTESVQETYLCNEFHYLKKD